MNRASVLAAAVVACWLTPQVVRADDGARPKAPDAVMPSHVDVCLTSVVVAPSKRDGSPWDVGGTKLTAKQLSELDSAFGTIVKLIGTNPAGVALEIANLFKQDALRALAKPDVFGQIELAPTGAYGTKAGKKLAVASKKKPVREFTPGFGTSVCFTDVAWNKGMRLRLTLTDKDLLEDDPISTVEVLGEDVERAFGHGKSWHVFVGDQDTMQLKFAVISVTKGPSAK